MAKVRYLGVPGEYEIVDMLDEHGKPHLIRRAWDNAAYRPLWYVQDSQGRVISQHTTKRDAIASL